MPNQTPHPWDLSPKQAVEIQEDLRHKVLQKDQTGEIHYLAAVDVGYPSDRSTARAGLVLTDYPGMTLWEKVIFSCETNFPYLPGLLSFREAPAVLGAMEELLRSLGQPPDVVLCDGHGLAHPRRFGLACHVGVLTGLPTIGVAKGKLVGEHNPLGPRKGDWVPLVDSGEVIGAALRTRDQVKPVYVSIGHKMDLDRAVELVMNCSPRFRIPEPLRRAHTLASERG